MTVIDGTDMPPQKRLGRPRLHHEARRQMNVMLPEALIDEIDVHLGAHPDAQSRNEWIEQALRAKLERLDNAHE